MANRRNLKKKIAHICGILAMECMVAVQNGRITVEQSDQIIVDILNLQDEFFSRINHTEKGSERLFYRKLTQDFDKGVELIIQKIQ